MLAMQFEEPKHCPLPEAFSPSLKTAGKPAKGPRMESKMKTASHRLAE